MNNDRIKLKRLEPSLKKIVKWRREVQEKLETEKIGLSPAEILNTEKWYEGLKTAENAIYCLELIYRRRLMDQAAFAEPDSKARLIFLVLRSMDNETLHEYGRSNIEPYIVYNCILSSRKLENTISSNKILLQWNNYWPMKKD